MALMIKKNNSEIRSLQVGLRGEAVKKYVNEWIVHITDITDYVCELREKISAKEDVTALLLQEKIYVI